MEKETNLSDLFGKERYGDICEVNEDKIKEDIKEFIRLETELLRLYDLRKISYLEFIRRRIKLIGDELKESSHK